MLKYIREFMHTEIRSIKWRIQEWLRRRKEIVELNEIKAHNSRVMKKIQEIEITKEEIDKFMKSNKHISTDAFISVYDEDGKLWRLYSNEIGNSSAIIRMVKELKFKKIEREREVIKARRRFLSVVD